MAFHGIVYKNGVFRDSRTAGIDIGVGDVGCRTPPVVGRRVYGPFVVSGVKRGAPLEAGSGASLLGDDLNYPASAASAPYRVDAAGPLMVSTDSMSAGFRKSSALVP